MPNVRSWPGSSLLAVERNIQIFHFVSVFAATATTTLVDMCNKLPGPKNWRKDEKRKFYNNRNGRWISVPSLDRSILQAHKSDSDWRRVSKKTRPLFWLNFVLARLRPASLAHEELFMHEMTSKWMEIFLRSWQEKRRATTSVFSVFAVVVVV